MNRWISLFVLVVLGSGVTFGAPEGKTPYYVQLVRGNDEAQPPVSGAKAIGPKLSKPLSSGFRWKNYWEINRQEVAIAAGAKTKVALSKERAVEVDLSEPTKSTVTAFSNDNPVCVTTEPASKAMTIIGAERGQRSAWFVVVRRDKPSGD
jgi:hypothetical protein